MKVIALVLAAWVFACPRLDAGTIFTLVEGTDTIVTNANSLDLNWNFAALAGWDKVVQVLSVTFDLRLRDDQRTAANDDGDEFFRYALILPGANYRIFGDPATQLPDRAGNTDYSATPADGAASSNGGVLQFNDLLSGNFTTRVNATQGDLEFRRASVTIDTQTVPEPSSLGLGAAGLALVGLAHGARRTRKR